MNRIINWTSLVPISNSRYCWLTLPFALLSIAGSAVAGVASHYFELYLFAMVYWAYQYQVIQLRKSPALVFVPQLFKQYVYACFGQLYLLILTKFLVTLWISGFEPALSVTGWLVLLHLGMAWGAVKSNLASQWPLYLLLPPLMLEIDLASALPMHGSLVFAVIGAAAYSHSLMTQRHMQKTNQTGDIIHYEWRWIPSFSNHSIVLLNPVLRFALWGKHAGVGGVLFAFFLIGILSAMVPAIMQYEWTTLEAWMLGGAFTVLACTILPSSPDQVTRLWQALPHSRGQISNQLALSFVMLQMITPLVAMIAWLIIGTSDLQQGVVQTIAMAALATSAMFGVALIAHNGVWWQLLIKSVSTIIALIFIGIFTSFKPTIQIALGAVSVPLAVYLHSKWHQRMVQG